MIVRGEPLLPRVVSVQPLPGLVLDLVFTNGERKLFDASELLKFPAYRNLPNVFSLARVAYGTVVWPGDLDVSPDKLYLKSVAQKEVTA